ncbi:hypothetical protein FQN60_002078 [Etheostoma spectabile]|uniref:Uncharacterized protein n=1 Tax=Etheostoma spectabile TaxID=54343 RepID=A0A5J5DD92_9PERO|nr:hypothetical protein FQN60_002078 [Etheostoma spectabile]
MQTGGVEFTALTFQTLLWQKSSFFAWQTAELALMRPGILPINFPCGFPTNGQHLAGLSGPYPLLLAHPLRPGSSPSALQVQRDSRGSRSWPGSPAHMEGDVMDKVEATATVCDFDPISGSIPATKVEITVSCRPSYFKLGSVLMPPGSVDLQLPLLVHGQDMERRDEGKFTVSQVQSALPGNLLDRDTFSKSDPLVVLYTQGVESKQWRESGELALAHSKANLGAGSSDTTKYGWLEQLSLCHHSSVIQLLFCGTNSPICYNSFPVIHQENNIMKSQVDFGDVSKTELQDFLGQIYCTLGEIVGSPASRLEKPLGGIPGKKCGTIILSAEELGNCRDYATMQFCANKLDKKDFFGKSDPFMVFYRSNEDGTFTICHKTEVVKNTLNPVWQPFSIPVRALCNGDYERTQEEQGVGHDFIGEFTTIYKELCRGQNQLNVYEVVNAKKKIKKKRYIHSGTVRLSSEMRENLLVSLLSFSVESEHTFLDYIKGGTFTEIAERSSSMLVNELESESPPEEGAIIGDTALVGISEWRTQIHFTVAIDFTASNGNPSQSTSLHYMNPYQMNAYAMALKAVGEIIQDYDSDKMFPALGFGAKLPPDGRVSHEFPLNGNIENPYCNGMEGILEAYHQSLKTVQLYGPTNFAPVVNHVASYAAAVQDGSQYFVLLIITDGVISDMAQTKEAIVNAAKLPMSIIIVGVGQAEFDAMIELDGDDIRISSRGKLAERDIVQFVPFRDYMDRTGNHVLSMARLAKDVLAEIPDQLISYMKSRGIKPNPVPPAYSFGDQPQTNPV